MQAVQEPSIDVLLDRLRDTASRFNWGWTPLEVIARSIPWARSPRKRGYHSELLEVRDSTGSMHILFAKTGPARESEDPYRGGLPGGLAYEHTATTLARRLAPADSVPTVLGFGPATGPLVTLFLEHIPSGADHGRHSVIARAVDWLTDFQAGDGSAPSIDLNVFSRAFYERWIEPFGEVATFWGRSLGIPHLDGGRRAAELLREDADRLTADGLGTVVHGDFFVSNMIASPTHLVVIDWELAAIASGAIDLAALTLGWDSTTIARSDARYVRAASTRFGAEPEDVRASIAAARRHVIARVVGGFPPPDPADGRRVRRLRSRLQQFVDLLGSSTG